MIMRFKGQFVSYTDNTLHMKAITLLSLLVLVVAYGCTSDQQAKASTTTSVPVTTVLTNGSAVREGQMLSTPSAESIIDALKEAGIHIYNINLPKIDLEKYQLILYRDTYLNGIKSIHPSYPRQAELKSTTFTNDQNRYRVVLTLMDKNDSLFTESWQLPSGHRTATISKKERQHFIDYNVTPFKSQEIVPGKKIPILIYGSSWIDKKTGYYRYCMERELEPDFSNDAFKRMPGYYVYSIELKAIK